MEQIWLIEFLTEDDDYDFVSFREKPTEQDILEYISGVDWLQEELESDTLSWIETEIELINNKDKHE